MATRPRSIHDDMDAASREDITFANPCFLGSSGENSEIFERLLLEFLRDHVYWRRNFHPEDPLSIPVLAMHKPAYMDFMDRTRTELHSLTAALKRSVPFFNPRYMGHMVSDLMLPGLLAHEITTLYNPNNVSEEAAPVTLNMEITVGEQLAAMLGFAVDETASPRAWGHLTSGGTLANYESLVNLRAARMFPLALKDALDAAGLHDLPLLPAGMPDLSTLDDWTLINLPLDTVMELPERLRHVAGNTLQGSKGRELMNVLTRLRVEARGMVEFARHHPVCGNLRVLLPVTAHYSWRKAARILGFGETQFVPVPVDSHMRISIPALKQALADAQIAHVPVLAVIAVLGTTEFGTIDPVHRIVELRQHCRARGFEFGLHVDGAWGGYLTSIFREADGDFASRSEVSREFSYFPSDAVYRSFAALKAVDSVTVDPHKLGYLPYGIGGIVWRDRRITGFLGERAPYVFDSGKDAETSHRPMQIGQYILEGSKPGAAAASAWVAHRVLPLDREHFGRLQRQTIRATEYFFDQIPLLADRLAGVARIVVPFEPDTNLMCLAVNPANNHSLAAMNRFGQRLYRHLGIDPTQPVQVREFFSSRTAVNRRMLDQKELDKLLSALDIDPETFVEFVDDDHDQAENLFLLRHTLMNPWLLEEQNGSNYIDRYCVYLERIIREECKAASVIR